ncbi:hypothetical protein GOB25_33075 [Sinorhizobium meliloti]|nr:hypothetical protein [Sinorhizobium meliloti]
MQQSASAFGFKAGVLKSAKIQQYIDKYIEFSATHRLLRMSLVAPFRFMRLFSHGGISRDSGAYALDQFLRR